MKKIISYLLVFAMLFTLAIPVFAVSASSVWSGIVAVSDVVGVYQTAADVISLVSNGSSTGVSEFDRGGGSTRGGGAGRRPVEYATGGSGNYGYMGEATSSGADTNYIYTGIGDGGGTSYYQAVSSINNTWYNPVTYNFTSTLNMSYSPTYNTYYIEDNEYKSYVIDNTTYISYYIIENTESDTPYTWYYEIYYQLPDGRYSYDLTAEDVWGTYFLYDAVNYDEVVEDDGTTLALLHFDGNIFDSSAHNNAVSYTANASYNFIDSDFTSALSWSDSAAHTMTVALPEPLAGDFTIEGRIKISDSSSVTEYYNSSFEKLDFSTASGGSDSALRTVAQNRLGSNGTFDTSSASTMYPWVYKVSGTFYKNVLGSGHGVLFLDSTSLFKGNNSSLSSYTGATASYSYMSYNNSHSLYFNTSGSATSVASYTQILNDVLSFAFVRSGDTVTYYENGLEKYSFEYAGTDCETLSLKSSAKQTIVFDELRVSNKALYMDTYTPSSQPFDTNLVLVLPDQGEVNQIAVKSNTAVADLRVGGVRPTYPSNGDVYVYLEDDVVKAVEQYQTDGWYSVDACIYEEGAGWTSFSNYNLSAYVSEAPEEDDDGSGSGGAGDSGNTGDGSGDSSGGGDLNLGTDGILGELISAVFGGVVSAITAALQGLLSIFTALIEFTTGFGSFLGSAFVFIPGEIISVITSGITLMVVLAVIRFIRG